MANKIFVMKKRMKHLGLLINVQLENNFGDVFHGDFVDLYFITFLSIR